MRRNDPGGLYQAVRHLGMRFVDLWRRLLIQHDRGKGSRSGDIRHCGGTGGFAYARSVGWSIPVQNQPASSADVSGCTRGIGGGCGSRCLDSSAPGVPGRSDAEPARRRMLVIRARWPIGLPRVARLLRLLKPAQSTRDPPQPQQTRNCKTESFERIAPVSLAESRTAPEREAPGRSLWRVTPCARRRPRCRIRLAPTRPSVPQNGRSQGTRSRSSVSPDRESASSPSLHSANRAPRMDSAVVRSYRPFQT